MADIVALPQPKRPQPWATNRLPETGGRRQEYAIGDLARLLKLSHLRSTTIIKRLRSLHLQKAMPLPITPREYGGKICTGSDAIYRHSRWDAERFDAWLQTYLGPPPAGEGVLLPVPANRLDAELALRARQQAVA